MNMNAIIEGSVMITFEGQPMKPEIAHEILWRTDTLHMSRHSELWQTLTPLIFSKFTEKEKMIILQPRDPLYGPGSHNNNCSDTIINNLIIEILKNKLHSLPTSDLTSHAIANYGNRWNYGYASFLSWTGNWTKTKNWIQKQWSYNSIINDWKLITKEFPTITTKIQYEVITHYNSNADNSNLTIYIENGTLAWKLNDTLLRPNDNSYSCMRKPPLEKLIESFKNVTKKFAGSDPTSRLQLSTSKKHKTMAVRKRNN